jgi:adenylate cyclase
VPLARELGPEKVVGVLNRVVSEFDALAATHGIEKIKTIGDAYMAAGGLPVPRPDHLDRLVRMALDMQRTLAALRAETGLKLHMRIGLASGPVMAGIIGCNKFSYDMWGDTVNLAARLESQSRPDRVLICPNCRAKLDGRFTFESMGRLEIKGVGEVEAWLVDDTSDGRAAAARG